jgi:hypothetical protein
MGVDLEEDMNRKCTLINYILNVFSTKISFHAIKEYILTIKYVLLVQEQSSNKGRKRPACPSISKETCSICKKNRH